MAQDLMRYDLLAQDALRGVVRAALLRVEQTGLPGEHHFYVSLNTRHPDVRISERLRKKYEKEMTIVLQHQFWNLRVHDQEFEVELSFNDVPEKLIVPFSAIKGFFDPAAQFALQFEMPEGKIETMPAPAMAVPGPLAKPNIAPEPEALLAPPPAGQPRPSNDDTKIVSLDSFRKK
ncbi:MAG TPA: ClpXP protease specificity-enhancing factor SspB [Aestuariivirgaceae bacterium]|nr:ClpXP protease specificity-enhancing factor SspB [Aestuariivirgaceae bacterium]